jgi:hypothetical protein
MTNPHGAASYEWELNDGYGDHNDWGKTDRELLVSRGPPRGYYPAGACATPCSLSLPIR